MTGQIVLSPNELAELIGTYMSCAGLPSNITLTLYNESNQMVGYDRAEISYPLEELPGPTMTAEDLRRALYPNG